MAKTSKQLLSLLFTLCFSHCCTSQKPCPPCGPLEVPYPLSTSPGCGDRDYALRCDPDSRKLRFVALNGTSYEVLRVSPERQRLVVNPAPWLDDECVTHDMAVSEGLWLNQSLPFNVTSANTVFLLNCSPRLLVSPLNCTPASLCHRYLSADPSLSARCARQLAPCCTFVAGGSPSAYKIRLHGSGCKAFRSVIRLEADQDAREWEEGLEIQWAPPREPVCTMQRDCSGASACTRDGKEAVSRCLCQKGYAWDHLVGLCSKTKNGGTSRIKLRYVKIATGVVVFLSLAAITAVFGARKLRGESWKRTSFAKAREEMLTFQGGKSTKMVFSLKEMKKATNGFAKDRILGSGGFGEVYKGQLRDGTIVAVKSAKVGNIKSTEQVLNEVDILSRVNHKNLVKLLGCCVDSKQPLMIYEYIPNGTLHAHLHCKFPAFLDWKTRLKIALQTAEALAYLHSSAHTPIFHRDIKSTNILLDEEFNAKVADFGLSRLASPGLSHVSTCAQGTLGYLDPEYYRNYKLTDKSDVYSYGVVLLELLTSQSAIDFSRDEEDVNLATYVKERAKRSPVSEIADRTLIGKETSSDDVSKSLKLFLELALSCLKEKKEDRPSMRIVVHELQCIIQIVDHDHVDK